MNKDNNSSGILNQEDFNKVFGENIRVFRTKIGISQQELGNSAGLSKQAINDIEKGRRSTQVIKAIALAERLNTTVEELSRLSAD